MNIPILTVKTIPDGYEHIGLIHAMSVHAINIIRDVFSDITSIVGGKQGLLESIYNETLNEALHNLKLEAQKVNADLITGLDIDISTDEQFYVFFCTATALRKKKIRNNRKNESSRKIESSRKSRTSSKKPGNNNRTNSKKTSKKE